MKEVSKHVFISQKLITSLFVMAGRTPLHVATVENELVMIKVIKAMNNISIKMTLTGSKVHHFNSFIPWFVFFLQMLIQALKDDPWAAEPILSLTDKVNYWCVNSYCFSYFVSLENKRIMAGTEIVWALVSPHLESDVHFLFLLSSSNKAKCCNWLDVPWYILGLMI